MLEQIFKNWEIRISPSLGENQYKRSDSSTSFNILIFILIFFIVSGFVTVPSIQAQDLTKEKIRIYTIADGLPSNNILCMDQDRRGDLWIGTEKGASRFDGKSFTNYGAKDGFSDKEVWAILCDSKGFISFQSHKK